MATYKRRGGKLKKDAKHAIEQDSATAEVFETLDTGAGKAEQWVAKNQRYILITIVSIMVISLLYLAYRNFVFEPKIAESNNELFQAQFYFDQALNNESQQDSLFHLALSGGEGKYGFLDIVDVYSGTPAANISHYSAGMIYLKLRQFDNAIYHLDTFTSDDPILSALAYGAIGDSFVELDQHNDALPYYEKAINNSENSLTEPRFLLKAGLVALDLAKKKTALGYFERLRDQYPSAEEARKIEVLIGRASF